MTDQQDPQPQEPDLDQLADKARRLIDKLDQPLPPPVDLGQLNELAEWIRTRKPMRDLDPLDVRPSDIQRRYGVPRGEAVALLEALERRGDIELVSSAIPAWRPAQKPPKGHQLSLSDREREVLLRELDDLGKIPRLLDALRAQWDGGSPARTVKGPTLLLQQLDSTIEALMDGQRLDALRGLRERLRRTP